MTKTTTLALGAVLGASIVAALGGAALAGPEGEAHWPQWRGPALDGSSAATGLPLRWSETTNVAWKVKLPAWGAATPAVWGDRVFVATSTSPDDGAAPTRKRWRSSAGPVGEDVVLICLSAQSGEQLWRTKIAGGNAVWGKQDTSSPSPITDGEMVWTMTGTGVVAGLDMQGKIVWQASLQEKHGRFGLNWGYGASPLLHDGKLIVPVLHGTATRGPSYLVAFDAKTGEELWKVNRPTDAVAESPDAYTTPAVMRVGDRTDIVISGADVVTGHDPATGKELWRCSGLNPRRHGNYRIVASPLVVGDTVYTCGRAGPMLAVRGGGAGDVTGTHTAWKNAEVSYDVPTPVSDGERIYILHDRGMLTCLDAKTGEVIYDKQRLPRGIYDASPLIAEGRIYCTNEAGTTTVVKAGPRFQILAENQLEDRYTLASIAVGGKSLFIRTSTHLYKITEGATGGGGEGRKVY